MISDFGMGARPTMLRADADLEQEVRRSGVFVCSEFQRRDGRDAESDGVLPTRTSRRFPAPRRLGAKDTEKRRRICGATESLHSRMAVSATKSSFASEDAN